MLPTFPGGVKPPSNKSLTREASITPAGIPDRVIIPLSQHAGHPAKPVVAPGQEVLTGQLIAQAEGPVSSPVHSSVTGTVQKIDLYTHPVLGSGQAVEIAAQPEDRFAAPFAEDLSRLDLPADQLLPIVREAGIVGLGGAGFPAHIKLTLLPGRKVDTVVLNAAECEPYLTCDYRLLIERPLQVLLGLEIVLRILGAARAVVGLEKHASPAADSLREAQTLLPPGLRAAAAEVRLMKVKYPQGAEKTLVKALLGREIPSGCLPFNVGATVINVGTAHAVYEAVCLSKPLFERVVTLTGRTLPRPGNFLVRIGTSARHLLGLCGADTDNLGKIVFGGPMMGFAQFSADVPVTKGTSGILALSPGESPADARVLPCIRCGRCVRACSMHLIPSDIMRAVDSGRFDRLKDLSVRDCMECGACTFACPSGIRLNDYLKLAKTRARHL